MEMRGLTAARDVGATQCLPPMLSSRSTPHSCSHRATEKGDVAPIHGGKLRRCSEAEKRVPRGPSPSLLHSPRRPSSQNACNLRVAPRWRGPGSREKIPYKSKADQGKTKCILGLCLLQKKCCFPLNNSVFFRYTINKMRTTPLYGHSTYSHSPPTLSESVPMPSLLVLMPAFHPISEPQGSIFY